MKNRRVCMYKRNFNLEFDSNREAKVFFESIAPELEEKFLRSSVKVVVEKNLVKISISASDKTALRASENSILKPFGILKKLEELE
ncbi:MAG: KEOPS complex subunit Pcc1 [Candidatus Diapherotrites archaeon]|nr:KEOPS complex subunit Pcc1 [Candidatus Diapherotrites archaeon]